MRLRFLKPQIGVEERKIKKGRTGREEGASYDCDGSKARVKHSNALVLTSRREQTALTIPVDRKYRVVVSR